jgi:hypothetical protein
MQKTNLETVILSGAKGKSENAWTIKITNSTNKLAFFIRPQLMVDEEEVLPSFWSGNYFTLAPSETKIVTVSCPLEKIYGKTPVIKISGWNVERQTLVIK